MNPAVFDDLDELLRAAPLDLGATDWITVEPLSVTAFGASTFGGPSGASAETIPPYMLVSLTNRLLPDLLQVPGAASGVNYGAESVRFGDPVAVGSRVRARAVLVTAAEVKGGIQTTVEITVEGAGSSGEPPCVVRSLSRWLR